MDKIDRLISVSARLTVFFEEPFWIGVFERISGEVLLIFPIVPVIMKVLVFSISISVFQHGCHL